MESLTPQLESLHSPLHLVIGVCADKDLTEILPLLPKSATYYFTNAEIKRALPAEQLRQAAASFGLSGTVYSHVPEAVPIRPQVSQRGRHNFRGRQLVCRSRLAQHTSPTVD